MDDRRGQAGGTGRRSKVPWLIGAVLVALALFFALRGTFEQIDRDGGSNADAGTPNAGPNAAATPNRSSTEDGSAR